MLGSRPAMTVMSNHSGSFVDCQVTICHDPPRFAHTSVNRTPKDIGFPPDVTLIRATPVSTTVSPQSCATTSDGTTDEYTVAPDCMLPIRLAFVSSRAEECV